MPRPYWKGSISFGLVNVPVALTPATVSKNVKFHLYHDADGGRIHEKRVCEQDGQEVPWKHVVKGFEISRGRVVTLTQEELRAADPERDRTISIEEFVKPEEIDLLQVDQSYHVAPDGRASKAYALLVQALGRTGLVAVGRIVLSTKEHLCILRSTESRLVLTTLVWADEVREPPEVGRTAANGRELQMAERLIRSMAGHFEPKRFHDEHRARVEALLEKKASGKTIEVAPTSRPSRVVDLAHALEQSLAAARRPGAASRAQPARARRRAPPARARARRR
jgi:DNA end-binding protein Ku